MSEITSEKESIVKTLLTSSMPINLSAKFISSVQRPYKHGTFSTHSYTKYTEENLTKKHSASNNSKSLTEVDKTHVLMDHAYARPLNWTPESAFFHPTKTLFMTPKLTNKRKFIKLFSEDDTDEIIDVESTPVEQLELYDKNKALYLMDECERHAVLARGNQENEHWEDSISRLNWSSTQHKLFNGIINILNSDHLARLAHKGAYHEPVLRRIVIDKSVKRVRHLFSTILWDYRLTQWLHQLLIDNLNTSYLTAYLDILQTLKTKLPTFVDKMIYGPNATNRIGATSNENLFHLLKRPWDPFSSHLAQNKPRKLPSNPIILIVPSTPSTSNPNQYKRQLKWTNLLSNLATVVAVHTNIGNTANRLTMISCADQMLAATRAKVQEVKSDFPGRPVILVGFNAGSSLALQVAQVEYINCVICLGFSLLTAEGKRGDPDDSLLDLQCPVLFVVGQCSNTTLQEDIEDLRERMHIENGLIVVGSADDHLRVNKKKKRSEGVTQSAVDRIIVENIGEFLSGILLAPPQTRQVSSDIPPIKRIKVERKRYNSNDSFIDRESPSPTPRITRPVGRPPGSKSKNKLEPKWAVQGIPSPNSDTSSPFTPSTNDFSHSSLSTSQSEMFSVDKVTSKNTSAYDLAKNMHDVLSSTLAADGSTNMSNLSNKIVTSPAAKMGTNRSLFTSGSTLSNYLQNTSRPTTSTSQNSNIKVLENLTFNPNSSAKLVSSTTGRAIDLSKITILNSTKTSSTVGNVVLLPDGKIKPLGSTVKGTGSTPLLLPMSNTKSKMSSISPHNPGNRIPKYITSKKQLLGRRPPHLITKSSIVPTISTTLPPPTNLTSQDIMDLPIIFADDNQMLTDNSKLQQSDVVALPDVIQTILPPKPNPPNNLGKFIFINNKATQSLATTSTINTTSTLKRSTLSVPIRTTNSSKYTRIILSRNSIVDPKSSAGSNFTKFNNLPSEISIRKVEMPAPLMEDVENEIVSSTIPKPDYQISNIKDITYKNESDHNTDKKLEECQNQLNTTNSIANEVKMEKETNEVSSPKIVKIVTNL